MELSPIFEPPDDTFYDSVYKFTSATKVCRTLKHRDVGLSILQASFKSSIKEHC